MGATGAVGQELLRLLIDRKFPAGSIELFASKRSAGRAVEAGGKTYTIRETKPDVFEGLDLAFLATSSDLSRELFPEAVGRGCVVIDNSSALRMDPEVPLVIAEINAGAAHRHRGVIANPNCSIAVTLMGLYPLHCAFGLKRAICATYQAVSGAGAEGITELETQVSAIMNGMEPDKPKVFPGHAIAYNVIPHVDRFGEDGYTGEERKMMMEARKILDLPDLKLSATCVRVPVYRAHSIACNAEFEKPVSLKLARQAIEMFEGAELWDEPEELRYPTPLRYSERVPCGVGRLRIDSALDNGIAFFASGDQLWKGAALNCVQTAECLEMADLIRVPDNPYGSGKDRLAPARKKRKAAKTKAAAKKKRKG